MNVVGAPKTASRFKAERFLEPFSKDDPQ